MIDDPEMIHAEDRAPLHGNGIETVADSEKPRPVICIRKKMGGKAKHEFLRLGLPI